MELESIKSECSQCKTYKQKVEQLEEELKEKRSVCSVCGFTDKITEAEYNKDEEQNSYSVNKESSSKNEDAENDLELCESSNQTDMEHNENISNVSSQLVSRGFHKIQLSVGPGGSALDDTPGITPGQNITSKSGHPNTCSKEIGAGAVPKTSKHDHHETVDKYVNDGIIDKTQENVLFEPDITKIPQKERTEHKSDSTNRSQEPKRHYCNNKDITGARSLNNLSKQAVSDICNKQGKPPDQYQFLNPELTAKPDVESSLNSDYQSHPVTQPTDQKYEPSMPTSDPTDKEFQTSVINDIVTKLQRLQKHCQLLTETKAIIENDMINMQKQHHATMKEMARNQQMLREENTALKLKQKPLSGHEELTAQPLASLQSNLSDNFVHVQQMQKQVQNDKEMDESDLMSLKQLDEKDRMIEKYKTHMQKLAVANQSWFEQHQQIQSDFTEKIQKLQKQLQAKEDALKEQLKNSQEVQQNLERESQHEREQRLAFEKMYKSVRDRLEKEVQPYKERAEKAEKEATMYREQLVKAMDDKDQLHIENRKLQTEAWVKQQAGISSGQGSTELEHLKTQLDVLKHQATTWKDDFERERKDRTKSQAETDRQKKKKDALYVELQNAEYRIEGLTRDLQNLRARNIELERKLAEHRNPSPPPEYVNASRNSPPSFRLLDYPSNHPGRWNCRKCTYSNIPERSTCELCGATRETRRSSPGHYTAPQQTSDIRFPQYQLSRDVVPDKHYMRH